MRISDWSSDVCSSDLLADILLDRDRLESRGGIEVAVDAFHRVAVELQQRLELSQHQFLVVQPVRDDVDAQREAVVRHGLAVAIDDPAAARRRSEERRVGNTWVSQCHFWVAPYS